MCVFHMQDMSNVGPYRAQHVLQAAQDVLDSNTSATILDAGAGTGHFGQLVRIMDRGKSVQEYLSMRLKIFVIGTTNAAKTFFANGPTL